LTDLSDLATGTTLEELEFGDAIWDKSVFRTLEPIGSLLGLRHLRMSAKRIEDGRVQAIGALQKLQTVDFPANMFTTEQVAWLRARLPDTTTGMFLKPIEVLERKQAAVLGDRDVLVIGKRKPWLNSELDADRIRRFVDDFWRMVGQFRAMPTAEPRPITYAKRVIR
jgi:hypothetical protein